MLRRKYEFKPDRQEAGVLSKLYVTRKQRLSVLRWGLIGLCLLALSLLQDVVLSQWRPFGTATDLVCGGILLCAMLLGVEQSGAFVLWASLIYYFAGFAPGVQSIALLTVLGTVLNIFRHSYLRKSPFSVVACAGLALLAYEMIIFVIALFLQQTTALRLGRFLMGALMTVAVMPAMYPVFSAITRIGGEAWKE